MACTTQFPDKPLSKTIETTATSPHGLAKGKALAAWHRAAETALDDLEQAATDWRDGFTCPPPCVKGGTGQVAISNPQPKCYPDAKDNSCVCVGTVSVSAWVDCLDPTMAQLIEDGTVETKILDHEFS